jgi:hypothetical protein
MIIAKLLLSLVLAFLPLVPVVFTVPIIRAIVGIALLGWWMLDPSWGAWVYAGICLNVMQYRGWHLYVGKMRMSAYVLSPSMKMQNSSSVWLGIGAVIGGLRSLALGDPAGVVIAGLVAALLFGLQALLFPNPRIIVQACGYPFVSSECVSSLLPLLEKLDYPTLLRFNRQTRKAGIPGGPIIAAELAKLLDEKGSPKQAR